VLGIAIALIVIGVVLGFLMPWFAFFPAVVGLVLVVLFVTGFVRRAREGRP
jgi:hypothetical protein